MIIRPPSQVENLRKILTGAEAAKVRGELAHETERIVRIFQESWDMSDPERGVAVIAQDCHFEDMARGSKS